MMEQPDTSTWPIYFQSQPGQIEQASESPLRIPAVVVDLFVLRDPQSGCAERVAVVACLEGLIDVVIGATNAALDHAIQGQIQVAEVNGRGRFRQITAAELYIATLDAVGQEVQIRGYNDAVYLYGRMQARLAFERGKVCVTRPGGAGRFAVGRLDALYACKEAAAHVFQSPRANDERVCHLLIPAASPEEVARGRGIALVYPLLDPLAFANIGNAVIVMRTAYDLLARLQQDMIAEHHPHPLTAVTIPVPSRIRLERELEADGYVIQGEVAIKRAGAHDKPLQASTTFLSRLRTLAAEWAAPRIALPPQATLDDYRAIIEELLPALATPADSAMMRVLSQIIDVNVAPARRASLPSESTHLRASADVGSQGALSNTQVPAVQQAADHKPKPSWSHDFAPPARAPQKAAQLMAGCPEDTMTAYTGETRRLTSRDEWILDFLAEQGAKPLQAPKTECSGPSETSDWDRDFAPAAPPKRPDAVSKDWADDFETNA